MSDLISRESVIKELNELRRYVPFPSSKDVFDIIMKAKAIEQGEPVAELKITWGSDTGYEYGLTLIGGALASQKEYDDWIVSNFKGEGVFKLYTTPQQPQEQGKLVRKVVAEALEEAAKICDKEMMYGLGNKIRALIKRNTEGVE